MRIKFLLSFILVLSALYLAADTIYSTPEGGVWDNVNTWAGGEVPSNGDDVVIVGPVQAINTICANLTVSSGGYLMNQSNGSRTLTVNGNVENQGIIGNHPSYNVLYLRVGGNITSSGTIRCQTVYLINSDDQILHFTSPFSVNSFYNEKDGGSVAADSDINFIGTDVYFYDNVLDASGHDISFEQGAIADNLYLHCSTLSFDGSGYLQSCQFWCDTLEGSFYFYQDNVFNTDIVNNAILQNQSNSSQTVQFLGNLTNNNIIRNNVSYNTLRLNFQGNLVNDGQITCSAVELIGTDQHVSATDGALIDVGHFYGNTDANTLYFDTDIDLNGSVDLNWNTLVLAPGTTLSMDGSSLYEGTIEGQGSTISMVNGSSTWETTFDNAVADGLWQINSTVIFTGNAMIEGILQNHQNGSRNAIFDGDLINNGEIRNNLSYNVLNVECRGDITNNGVWNTNSLLLNSETMDIECAPGSSFSVTTVSAATASLTYNLNSDVAFIGSMVDLDGGTFNMAPGTTLTLSGLQFYDTNVDANGSTIDFLNGSLITQSTIDNATLDGLCQIRDSNVYFTGDTTLNGTIQNHQAGSYNTYFNGPFTNNGTIRNHPSYSSLGVYVNNQCTNNGVWQNSWLYFGDGVYVGAAPEATFDVSNVQISDNGVNVNFISDMAFVGTTFDLNLSSIHLSPDLLFSMDGGTLKNGAVDASGNTLSLQNGVTLSDITIDYATLDGIIYIYGGNVHFTGGLILDGDMMNHHYGTWHVNIDCDFVNNGAVANNPAGNGLYVNLAGNVRNNMIWTNARNYFTGSNQIVTAGSPTAIYNVGYVEGNGAGNQLTFDSYIVLYDTDFNLNGCTVVVSPGETLHAHNTHLRTGTLDLTQSDIEMQTGSYFQNITVNNPTIRGLGYVREGVTFTGMTVLEGAIQNHYQGSWTLNIQGDLINNHSMTNNPTGNALYVNLTGDYYHDAGCVCNIGSLTLNGTEQQRMVFAEGSYVQGPVNFLCDVSASTYRWYFDGEMIPDDDPYTSGVTSNNLHFPNGVSYSFDGTYNCHTNAGNSRNIIIGEQDPYSGLVAWYPFEGNTDDMSGNNHHATAHGNPQFALDRFGNPDSAIDFDGIDDYLNCGNWFTYQNFTLSFWVNQDQINSYYVDIIDNSHTDNINWVVQYNQPDGQYHLGTAPQGSAYFDPGFHRWTHVAVMKDGNVLRTYVDGIMVDEFTATSSNINYVSPMLNIAHWNNGGRYFDGHIDDIYMYDYALSDAQVMVLFTEDNPCPEAPWDMQIVENGNNFVISWTTVSGATSYKVYSDTDPYGDFSTFEQEVTEESCTVPRTGATKYFVVKAIR